MQYCFTAVMACVMQLSINGLLLKFETFQLQNDLSCYGSKLLMETLKHRIHTNCIENEMRGITRIDWTKQNSNSNKQLPTKEISSRNMETTKIKGKHISNRYFSFLRLLCGGQSALEHQLLCIFLNTSLWVFSFFATIRTNSVAKVKTD